MKARWALVSIAAGAPTAGPLGSLYWEVPAELGAWAGLGGLVGDAGEPKQRFPTPASSVGKLRHGGHRMLAPGHTVPSARCGYQELAQLLVPRRKAVEGFSYGSAERCTALAKIIRGRTHFQACDRSSPPSPGSLEENTPFFISLFFHGSAL